MTAFFEGSNTVAAWLTAFLWTAQLLLLVAFLFWGTQTKKEVSFLDGC